MCLFEMADITYGGRFIVGKKVALLLCLIIIAFLAILFLYPDKVIFYSGLYNIKNMNCQETFKVSIDPSPYNRLNAQIDINYIIDKRFDTIVSLEKIAVSPEHNTVDLFIKLDNRWNILKGECLVFYEVKGNNLDRSFGYEELDFSFTDSQGKKVPYSQYGLCNDTLIITLDKEEFFKHKGNIELELKLNNYIKYSLWFL